MPRRLLFAALVILPPVLEAAALHAVGFGSAVELAAQASTTGPLGVFHDLRWIAVYHDSWPLFATELLAVFLVRSGLHTALVSLAWPDGVPRPKVRTLVRANACFTVVAMAVLAPWAAIAVAASETSMSWFVFGELAPVLLLALASPPAALGAGWWRAAPSGATVGWSLAVFGWATTSAAALGSVSGWWVVPVAALAGAVNGLLWRRSVRAYLAARGRPARLPVPVLATMCSGVVLIGLGLFAPLGPIGADDPSPAFASAGTGLLRQAVINVAGYDSTYDGQPDGTGLDVVAYSYWGLDSGGRPLPYPADATHQSLATSAALLARQVEDVHRRTGRPVAVLAQSEGTFVVRDYLDSYPHPSLDAVVLVSPLVQPARVYFPPPEADAGWGIATGWELRAMAGLLRLTDGSDAGADEPFVRSLLDHALTYRDRMLCPTPGVRMIAFVPTADALVAPPGQPPGIPVVDVWGWHGDLSEQPDVRSRIVAFLAGRTAGDDRDPFYPLVQAAGAAWQAPALDPRLNPVWPARHPSDTTPGDPTCAG